MTSYWENEWYDKKYDVIIVGAGFSGLWLAYFLKKSNPKISILILEKGNFCDGASSKNAGFACFGSPTELQRNIDNLGLKKTLFWTKKRYQGIQTIKQCAGAYIDHNQCGGFELFESKLKFEQALESINNLNVALQEITNEYDHFKIENEICQSAEFKGFNHAIKNYQEGSLHPVLLLKFLTYNLINNGVEIRYNQEVKSVNECEIQLKNNETIKAKHICICTNAFTSMLLPQFDIKPGRGQVIITEEIKDLNWEGTFHFDEGYYYFRNVENRILLGGGRNLNYDAETTFSLENTDIIIDNLIDILQTKIYTKKPVKIAHTWSGTMGFTDNSEPFSDVINSSLSASIGMNGMGVALAPELSKDLAQKIIELL